MSVAVKLSHRRVFGYVNRDFGNISARLRSATMAGKMTDKNDKEMTGRQREAEAKRKRRSDQLRRNLMQRKAQARARRSGAEDARDEGLPAARPGVSNDDN